MVKGQRAEEAKPDHLTPGPGKRRVRCFECDGGGMMCGACGESMAVCECGEAAAPEACGNCHGGGFAYATVADA